MVTTSHGIQEDGSNTVIENDNNIWIFWDRAVDKERNKFGVCGLAYNRNKEILARFYKVLEGDSSFVAEIIALEVDVDMTLNCGWDKVKFFSDSSVCIECIYDAQVYAPFQIYAPFMKIKNHRSSFHIASFMHISRILKTRLATFIETVKFNVRWISSHDFINESSLSTIHVYRGMPYPI